MDITETLAPKSDQLNADDLIGGDRTVTITDVTRGDADQPVNIVTAEFGDGRPYKPCKSMRRVLVTAWGPDASVYVGRRLVLYRDDRVRFGGQDVGGIRIRAMSHIDRKLQVALTVTRGKRAPFTVDPLPDETPTPKSPKPPSAAAIVGAFDALGVTLEQLEKRVGRQQDAWTAEDVASLAALGKAIKGGTTTTFEEFPPESETPAEGVQETLT